MLKEGVSDYCHESVTVKSLPGPSLRNVEVEKFSQAFRSQRHRQKVLERAKKGSMPVAHYLHAIGKHSFRSSTKAIA
jgi:hypothetical protein